MRKITLSFPRCQVATALFILLSYTTLAQVPAFGPETFGNTTTLPTGWTVVDDKDDRNTWEVKTSFYASTGYANPDASGGCHIKIDGSATDKEFLYSPPIDFSNYTHGVLKMGIWRIKGYMEDLLISIDNDNDGYYDDYTQAIPINNMPPEEKWGLISIDLGTILDNKPVIRLKFHQTKRYSDYGPLRIDDITLYGNTSTLPVDHFRTRASGNWDNNTIWESSRDSIHWMPSTLTPTHLASSITIQNTHNVLNPTSLTVDQLTIKNGGTLMLACDLNLNDGNGEDLFIEEGGNLDLSTYHIAGTGTVSLNGHLKTALPEGLYGSDITSLTTGIGLNTPGATSIIEYTATGSQNISSQVVYANLLISGSGNKLLTGPTTVSNNLQISGSHLLLDAHNLIVGNKATATPSSHVKINGAGKLTIRNIDSEPKTFPIGNASYNPVVIAKGSGLDWTVGIEDMWVLAKPVLGTSNDKSIHRTWSITPFPNPPSVVPDILFEYDDTDPAQTGSGFNRDAPILVWRQAADNWLVVGESRYPGNSANGTKTASMRHDGVFSLFAISNIDMPLPVRFRNVNARQQQHAVLIAFTNETEIAIKDYTLERSADGLTYRSLQVIHPLKNDGTPVSYEVKDATPLEGLNLYRIKGTEKGGGITYSPVVRIHTKGGEARLIIAPNPANKGDILVQLANVPQDLYKVTLYNAEGQMLLHQTLKHPGGSASFPLKVDHLQSGTYIIELAGKEKLLQRFVIL